MQSMIAIILFGALFLPTPVLAASSHGVRYSGTDSPIEIRVDIATILKNKLSIVSVRGEKPGSKNAVETTIVVKNGSDINRQLLASGSWSDSRGNSYGGSSQVLHLAPNQTETLQAGTRSSNATHFTLSLTSNREGENNYLTDAVRGTSQKIAEGYGMTFSETAADEIVPALPIGGFANGEPFQGKTVVFAQGQADRWRLEISDQVFEVKKGAGFARYEQKDLQTIYLDLPREPAAGAKLVKEMAYGGGYFQIKPAPVANETTSWNTSIAYAIEFTDWNRGPAVEGPCSELETGSASGRLYISFKGSGLGLANSWVSGEFKDVPILYCGIK